MTSPSPLPAASLTLGVETSCDETALALVENGRLLSQVTATQARAHAVFGGVVPELAAREHLRFLRPLLDMLLAKAGRNLREVATVAVARGPGLLGCLLVGASFAKGLALGLGARLVGVSHLHAHLLAAGLDEEIVFPALGLLVSGGHTNLYLIAEGGPGRPDRFEQLGRTLDDAVGEAFDKAAKLLNLPYPGGRWLDELARGTKPDRTLFPRPYLDNDNLDFSFSGLKTAMAEFLRKRPELRLASLPDLQDSEGQQDAWLRDVSPEMRTVCASYVWSVVETLRVKTERALDATGRPGTLMLAGGVAANSQLRAAMAELAKRRGLTLVLPRPELCADNAAMVAFLGERLAGRGLAHGLDLEAVARGARVPEDWIASGPRGGCSGW